MRCLLFHGCCWAPVVSPALPRLRRKVSKAIKERSARNSESEVNSDRSVSLGRQGGLITSISAPLFPAFKPLPKVFSFRTDSTHCNCQRTTFFYLERASYRFYLRDQARNTTVQVWTVVEGFGIGSEFRQTGCAANNFRDHEVLFRWFNCSSRSPSGFVIHRG